MSEVKKHRTLLIADPDKDFLATIKADPNAQMAPPVLAHNGKLAQLNLADLTQPLIGVFVNAAITQPNGVSVIRAVHLHRPATPVYVIYDRNPPFDEKELHSLGIQKALLKPITYSQLVELVTPQISSFNPEKAVDSSKHKDQLDHEVNSEDLNFVPIRSDDFMGGSVSYFDVYVRLDSGRYLKILQAGDSFSIDRVDNYRKKGVTHFFIRKESQAQYLAYCDRIASTLIKMEKPGLIGVKISQTLNHGEETLKFLKNQGLSAANIQYAGQFIHNVEALVKQLNPGKHPILKGFLADVSAYEHGVGVTMLSALLVQSLQITSSDPVETVGLCSLMHDIGLKVLNLDSLEEDESKMTEYQRRIFRTHPVAGADFLKTVRGLKPVVIQAVAQHHERRNKKGFPLGIGAGSISLVAEIVGISDEFFRIIQKMKVDPKINLVEELTERVFNTFSHSIAAEFRKVFLFTGEPPSKIK